MEQELETPKKRSKYTCSESLVCHVKMAWPLTFSPDPRLQFMSATSLNVSFVTGGSSDNNEQVVRGLLGLGNFPSIFELHHTSVYQMLTESKE